MTRIMVMTETMSLAAVKARSRTRGSCRAPAGSRGGDPQRKPAAVLISADDLESLEETLAVMSDRSIAAQLRESQQAVAAGESGTDIDELRASLDRRRAGAQ